MYSRSFIIRFHRHLVGMGRPERVALAMRAKIELSSFLTSREKAKDAEPEYFIFWPGVKTRLIFIWLGLDCWRFGFGRFLGLDNFRVFEGLGGSGRA